MDRARTALARVAPDVGAGQVEVFPEGLDEQPSGFDVELPAARVSASLADLSSAYFDALAAIMDAPPGDR